MIKFVTNLIFECAAQRRKVMLIVLPSALFVQLTTEVKDLGIVGSDEAITQLEFHDVQISQGHEALLVETRAL